MWLHVIFTQVAIQSNLTSLLGSMTDLFVSYTAAKHQACEALAQTDSRPAQKIPMVHTACSRRKLGQQQSWLERTTYRSRMCNKEEQAQAVYIALTQQADLARQRSWLPAAYDYTERGVSCVSAAWSCSHNMQHTMQCSLAAPFTHCKWIDGVPSVEDQVFCVVGCSVLCCAVHASGSLPS